MHQTSTEPTSYRSHDRHIVKFFVHRQDLHETLDNYLRDGLERGDALIMVMEDHRWGQLRAHLQPQDWSLHDAIRREQLVHVSIPTSPREFPPDDEWFQSAVTELLAGLTQMWPAVRVYGELADALARRGRFDAVDRLEQRWNDCIDLHRCTLVCGYELTSFDEANDSPALTEALGDSQRVLAPGDTHSAPAVAWQQRTMASLRDRPSMP